MMTAAVTAALLEAGSAWGMHLTQEVKRKLMMEAILAALPHLASTKRESSVDEELRAVLQTGWELSTWAGSINWRGGENQKEWLDELRVLIEHFQDQSRTYVATRPESDWRKV